MVIEAVTRIIIGGCLLAIAIKVVPRDIRQLYDEDYNGEDNVAIAGASVIFLMLLIASIF